MEEIKNEFNLGNYLFSFKSKKSNCFVETTHPYATSIKETFKFAEIEDSENNFIFTTKDGLVTTNNVGTIQDKNILCQFISLNENNNEEIINFFKKYGYFYKINSVRLTEIAKDTLQKIIIHVRTIAELVTYINDRTSRDYDDMLNKLLYLLFEDPISIPTGRIKDNKPVYKTIGVKYKDAYSDLSNLPSVLSDEEQNAGEFELKVKDPIYNTIRTFKSNKLLSIFKDINNYDFAMRRFIVCYFNFAYRWEYVKDEFEHYLLAFLYNLQTKRGAICEAKGTKTTYNKLERYELDDQMKEAILYISKRITADDINQNILGVHPIFEYESMEPHWEISNLLTAMYFSLFYQKPGMKLWRRCQNPNCQRFFEIDRSSSRRKYCPDSGCGNAFRQSTYRHKDK